MIFTCCRGQYQATRCLGWERANASLRLYRNPTLKYIFEVWNWYIHWVRTLQRGDYLLCDREWFNLTFNPKYIQSHPNTATIWPNFLESVSPSLPVKERTDYKPWSVYWICRNKDSAHNSPLKVYMLDKCRFIYQIRYKLFGIWIET